MDNTLDELLQFIENFSISPDDKSIEEIKKFLNSWSLSDQYNVEKMYFLIMTSQPDKFNRGSECEFSSSVEIFLDILNTSKNIIECERLSNVMEITKIVAQRINQISREEDLIELIKSREKLAREQEEISNELEVAKESVGKLKADIESFKDTSKKLENKIEKQTIDHITILGIFASLIFSVFGGLESISAVFARVGDAPLNQLLIFTGIMIISMLAIIFIGFNAVSKIASKTISSSCHRKNCESSCNCRFHEKHPTLFYIGSLGILIIIIGFSYYIAVNFGTLLDDLTWQYFWMSSLGANIIMVVLSAIILCILYAIYFRITKNHYNSQR